MGSRAADAPGPALDTVPPPIEPLLDEDAPRVLVRDSPWHGHQENG